MEELKYDRQLVYEYAKNGLLNVTLISTISVKSAVTALTLHRNVFTPVQKL